MSIDDLESTVLARARDGLGPTQQRRKQLLERLTQVAGGVPPHPLSPSPDHPSLGGGGEGLRAWLNGPGQLMFTRRALSWVLLVGAAGGFAGGHAWGTAKHSHPPGGERQQHLDGAEGARPADVGTDAQSDQAQRAGPIASAEPQPIELAQLPSEEKAVVAPRSAILSRRGAASAPQAVAEVSFYEELSYVRRAQAALRDGQSALALGLMESLDALPTQGALWAERNMTKVLALCQLERAEEAISIAKRVLENEGGTTYGPRLRSSCVGQYLPSSSGD